MAYAITFDMDTKCLEECYGEDYNNAYSDIQRILEKWNFQRQQGSVYFGKDDTTSVDCMLAVQDLATQFDWFAVCIKGVRMLRIEELNDLKPAINKITDLKRTHKNY